MSKKFSRTTPKRLIAKVNVIIGVSLLQAGSSIVLFSADDSITLVRVVGNLHVTGFAAGPTTGVLGIIMARSGQSIAAISVTAGDPIYGIVRDILWGQGIRSTTTIESLANLIIDVKGMRILREGDSIRLIERSSADGDIFVFGTLTLFFKES